MRPHEPNPDLFSRWIDGELDDTTRAEFDSLWEAADAQTRAAMEAEKASSASLGNLLRENFPARRDVAGPELFMHQLAHRLDRTAEESQTGSSGASVFGETPVAGDARKIVSGSAGTSTFKPAWKSARWLAAAAAFVLGFFVMQSFSHRREQPGGSTAAGAPVGSAPLLASYAPDARIQMDASYNSELDAVVIVLEGLKPVDAPEDLVGFRANDPQPSESRLAGRVERDRASDTIIGAGDNS